MNFYRIRRAYRALDSKQKVFLKEKRIEKTLTIKEWQRFLKGLARYDKINDECRAGAIRTLSLATTLAVLLTILAAVFIVIRPTTLEQVGFILLMAFFASVTIGGLLLVLFNAIYSRKYKRYDLINHLRKFILPILLVLKEDAHAKTPVQLMLDFNKGNTKDKLLDQKDIKDEPPYIRLKEKTYRHQWAEAAIQLNDATNIQWKGYDDLKEVLDTRRRSSGRVKTKRKFKVKHWVDMRIVFQKEMYQLKNKVQAAEIMTETSDKYIFKLKVKQKYRVGRYPDGNENAISTNLFLAAIAQAYQQVEPISGTHAH